MEDISRLRADDFLPFTIRWYAVQVLCTAFILKKPEYNMISIAEICSWAEATPSSRNFVEGERLLSAQHVVYCGRSAASVDQCNKILAFCLQTSGLKDRPQEINGEFGINGQILSIKCSCKAGLSAKCKHVLAVLLFCNRKKLEDLEVTSCTDKKCLWNSRQESTLENLYNPLPLADHDCFKDCNDKIKISDDLKQIMRENLIACNPLSALAKHASGRHAPVLQYTQNGLSETQKYNINQIIICSSESLVMQNLAGIPFKPLRICCETVSIRLDGDVTKICEESAASHATWKKERQFRITGSRCYDLYTYINNKQPDWPKQSIKYFYPKSFTNKFVKHGCQFESSARAAYETATSEKVIECGLVVSQHNSFLAYSPDGIVFQNGKPCKLIEIKCPFSGKTISIGKALKDLKFSTIKNGNICLKKKHKYYGQVQFGMAVLNLKQTDFVIYAPFDDSIIILSVDLDETFVSLLFPALKVLYFNEMLHQVCLKERL